MSYTELLGRRSELLKRTIGRFIMKDNKKGLSTQESHMYQTMLREWHQNEQELKRS